MGRLIATCIALTVLLLPGVSFAAGADVSLTAPRQVRSGEMFQVVVSGVGLQDADTVRLVGTYDADLLEWDHAQTRAAFPNVSPGGSASYGSFSFGAFTLSGGVSGPATLAVFTFRARRPGTAVIMLGPGSRVLSGGVDQVGATGSVTIVVTGQEIPKGEAVPPTTVGDLTVTSETHPDPEAWYPSGDVRIAWDAPVGRRPVATYVGFDRSPDGPAGTEVVGNEARFMVTDDGVWYAHVEIRYADGSRDRVLFPVRIDRTPPRPISPTVDQTQVGPGVPNAVRFGTTDDASGILEYRVYVDEMLATTTQDTSYPLTGLASGTHTVIVDAVDAAGNVATGEASFVIADVAVSDARPVGRGMDGFMAAWEAYAAYFLGAGLVLLMTFSSWLVFARRRRRQETKKRRTRS
ncbi:cohesin domain-containing protein [Candidatus Uhrbacteria bacterium]|nr:cohesin domain-containing protein [Candidatus Uhrbacteria bacterium]